MLMFARAIPVLVFAESNPDTHARESVSVLSLPLSRSDVSSSFVCLGVSSSPGRFDFSCRPLRMGLSSLSEYSGLVVEVVTTLVQV